MKIQEIKSFISEHKMPSELRISVAENITDLEKFFDSHITTIESPLNTRRIKMIHYKRLMKVINLLKEQGVEKNDKVHEIEEKDTFEPLQEQEKPVGMKPNTSFDSEPAVERPKVERPPEPQRIKPKEPEKKKDIGGNQGTLF